MIAVYAAGAAAALAAGWAWSRTRRKKERTRLRREYLRRYPFPDGYRQKLARRLGALGIETSAELERVLEGLRAWFQISARAGRAPLSMPSKVVDEAWHEFILFTREYHLFCETAFGRYLHHVPAEAMATPAEASEGLRRAWRLSCLRERLDPRSAAMLPILFALDADLNVPGGYRYELRCDPSGRNEGDPYCAAHIGPAGCASGSMVACGASGGGENGGASCGGGAGDGGGGGGCGGGGCGGGCGGS